MATVLGSLPSDPHERAVYKALRERLPAEWWVVSNVSWSTRERDSYGASYVRDGQADFVVLAPALGMLVVEVKGSKFVRIAADGRWYRSSDGEKWQHIDGKTPPEQGMANSHQIAARIASNLKLGTFRFPYGFAVVYPQGKLHAGAFGMFDASTTLFKADMAKLLDRIQVALHARGSQSDAQRFTPSLAKEAALGLVDHGVVIGPAEDADDAQLTGLDSRAIEQLTRQQSAALQGIFGYPKVAVMGPAGSGKTVLALWRLAALLEDGASAVYLCFNKQLAEFLRLRNPSLARAIHHVDSYFGRVARNISQPGSERTRRFYDEELPGHVLDEVSGWPRDRKLDAVIVDEGQDFGELRLWATRELVRDGGTYLYCSDDRQDLYDRKVRDAVGADIVFSLVHNCRNTVKINETSNTVLGEAIAAMPGLPEGTVPEVRHCPGKKAMAKAAWELAAGWSGPGVRVAILSPFRFENSAMHEQPTGFNKHLVRNVAEWDEREAILFSTIKSFKGMEADAIVVVDIDAFDGSSALDRTDMYVACTRGRARLGLLCESEAALRRLYGTR